MPARTVRVRDPIDGGDFILTGSEDDGNMVGAILRSDGHFEPSLLQVAGSTLRRDDVCVDIGANVGFFSVFVAKHCPEGRVYAFEPGAENIEHLRASIDANGLHNVEVEPIGVYDRTGQVELHFTPENPSGSFVTGAAIDAGDVERIDVTSLDDWTATKGLDRIDVVKIDVEGSELRVVQGAEQTLRRLRPRLFVECNPISLRRFHGTSPSELVALLRSIYGSVRYLREGGVSLPLRGDVHLDIELGREGVIELACGLRRNPRPSWDRSLHRRFAATRLAGALYSRAGARAHVPRTFVHDPRLEGRFEVSHLTASPGELLTVPVVFRNLGTGWWNGDEPLHPVTIGHRWLLPDGARLGADDGQRTYLPAPVGPGQRLRTAVVVRAPMEPGEFGLRATPLQEGYLWFDDVVPEMTATMPVTVRR